jgi:hypothetical protein
MYLIHTCHPKLKTTFNCLGALSAGSLHAYKVETMVTTPPHTLSSPHGEEMLESKELQRALPWTWPGLLDSPPAFGHWE